MNWKVGDKGILEGEGINGRYEFIILSIDLDIVSIKCRQLEDVGMSKSWFNREDYALENLENHGTPITKLSKILA